MKSDLLKIVNRIFRPFNYSLVKNTSKDIRMTAAIRRIVEHTIPVNTIIDIGASDGKWCLQAMDFFPHSSFVAIEPLKERTAELEKCKQKYPNFDFETCVAGGSEGGYATLNVTPDLDGSTVDGLGNGKFSRQVPVKTIDSIVSEKVLKGPYLIKFDTHGYEVPILEGAAETLKNTNVIIMEVYNFQISKHALRFHEMCSYMETLCFRCYDIADPMLRLYDKSFWQMDLLFCRNTSKRFEYSSYK